MIRIDLRAVALAAVFSIAAGAPGTASAIPFFKRGGGAKVSPRAQRRAERRLQRRAAQEQIHQQRAAYKALLSHPELAAEHAKGRPQRRSARRWRAAAFAGAALNGMVTGALFVLGAKLMEPTVADAALFIGVPAFFYSMNAQFLSHAGGRFAAEAYRLDRARKVRVLERAQELSNSGAVAFPSVLREQLAKLKIEQRKEGR